MNHRCEGWPYELNVKKYFGPVLFELDATSGARRQNQRLEVMSLWQAPGSIRIDRLSGAIEQKLGGHKSGTDSQEGKEEGLEFRLSTHLKWVVLGEEMLAFPVQLGHHSIEDLELNGVARCNSGALVLGEGAKMFLATVILAVSKILGNDGDFTAILALDSSFAILLS